MKTMICIGDSLVFGPLVRRSECWTAKLGGRCGFRVINRGRNGDTTRGLLSRFDRQVLAERPDAVLLLAGSNDFFLRRDPAETRRFLLFLVREAEAYDIRTLLATIPPYLPSMAPAAFRKAVCLDDAQLLRLSLNEWIRSQKECVDFASVFESLTSDALRGFFADGLHLNAAGHLRLADAFSEWLRTHP